MVRLFWDASGLVKRYFLETGSDTVAALFAAVPVREMAATPWGYAESYSILLRRFNGGVLNLTSFTAAIAALQAEVVDNSDFALVSILDEAVFASTLLMRQHNLNATDAAILTVFLEYVQALPSKSPRCVLVAADQRLVRAAQAEGLITLNPELLPAADIPAFLASL